MIRLQLLGSVELRAADGRAVQSILAQPKRTALLAYLALARPRGFQRRDAVAARFWPEMDDDRARAALRSALHFVRQSLGDDAVEGRGQEEIALNAERVWCDAAAFDDALDAGRPDEAMALWRGELLDGFHVDDAPEWERWLDDERARLRRRAGEAARELGARAEASGDAAAAAEWARRAMELDPGDERSLRRLMSLLDGMGDRAGALRAHAGFAARLRADLDAAPSAETEALVRAIRARDVPAAPPASPEAAPAFGSPSIAAVSAGSPSPASAVPSASSVPDAASASSSSSPAPSFPSPPASATMGTGDSPASPALAADRTTEAAANDAASTAVHLPNPTKARSGAVVAKRRRWRHRRAVALAAVGMAVLAVAIPLLVAGRRQAPAAEVREGRIAVLPFTVLGTSRLAYLREGMVDLLAIRLDGEDELDAVDPLAVLGYARREHIVDADPDDGRRVAREFGAAQYVLGSVIWLGGKVQVIAALYTADGKLVAKATVTVDSEQEMNTLVDDLTRKLLAHRASPPGEQLSRAAALTTTSLPALQAFLQGEKEFRAGRLDAAAQAYGRAVDEDSTFALALYRLSTVLDWGGLTLDRRNPGDVVHQALRFGQRLAPHERMLLDARDAYWNGSAREAERLYRAVLATHPADMEAWNELGEVIFHRGVWMGMPITRARSPFEHVLALAPQNVGARLHLARIAALEGRAGEADTLVRAAMRLSPYPARSVEMRGLVAFGAGGTPVQRAEVERTLSGVGYDELWVNVWRIAVYTDDPAVGERLSRLLAADGRPARSQALALTTAASMQAAQGRWSAALASLAAAGAAEPAYAAQVRANLALLSPLPVSAAELASIRASLAAAPPAVPDTIADPLSHAIGYCPSLCRTYLLGALSARLGDTAAVGDAMRRIAATHPADAHEAELIRFQLHVLDARRMWSGGDAAGALRALQAGWPGQTLPRFSSYESYDHTAERFLRAELLHALGRDSEALAWYATVPEDLGAGIEYSAPAHLAQARILDARGERRQAASHYRRFIRAWRACDPALRPLLAEAERRAAALE